MLAKSMYAINRYWVFPKKYTEYIVLNWAAALEMLEEDLSERILQHIRREKTQKKKTTKVFDSEPLTIILFVNKKNWKFMAKQRHRRYLSYYF